MGYTSNLLPTGANARKPTSIINGSIAAGSALHEIAMWQHAAASGVYGTHCHQGSLGGGFTESTDTHFTFVLRVPPFAQWADFAFLVTGELDNVQTSYVEVSNQTDSDVVRATNMWTADYAGDPGRTNDPTVAKWVAIAGEPHSMYSGSSWTAYAENRSLQLKSTASRTWTEVTVKVQMSTGVKVWGSWYGIRSPTEYIVP